MSQRSQVSGVTLHCRVCSVVKTLIVSGNRQTDRQTKGQWVLLSCSGQLKMKAILLNILSEWPCIMVPCIMVPWSPLRACQTWRSLHHPRQPCVPRKATVLHVWSDAHQPPQLGGPQGQDSQECRQELSDFGTDAHQLQHSPDPWQQWEPESSRWSISTCCVISLILTSGRRSSRTIISANGSLNLGRWAQFTSTGGSLDWRRTKPAARAIQFTVEKSKIANVVTNVSSCSWI